MPRNENAQTPARSILDELSQDMEILRVKNNRLEEQIADQNQELLNLYRRLHSLTVIG